jgi:5-formyltetrahydrofolate cyclo-ligase
MSEIYATIYNMSNKLARKVKRKQTKRKLKQAKKELSNKIENILLPDECKNCKTVFDKTSKEMAMTWMVVAKEDRKHLICPKCWSKIKKLTRFHETQEDLPDQHQIP